MTARSYRARATSHREYQGVRRPPKRRAASSATVVLDESTHSDRPLPLAHRTSEHVACPACLEAIWDCWSSEWRRPSGSPRIASDTLATLPTKASSSAHRWRHPCDEPPRSGCSASALRATAFGGSGWLFPVDATGLTVGVEVLSHALAHVRQRQLEQLERPLEDGHGEQNGRGRAQPRSSGERNHASQRLFPTAKGKERETLRRLLRALARAGDIGGKRKRTDSFIGRKVAGRVNGQILPSWRTTLRR